MLDINSNKYLDDFVLRYFFKPIQNQMKLQGQEPIEFDDFSNEIFDMVRPATAKRIYIDDLLSRFSIRSFANCFFLIWSSFSSGYADTIISILIDLNGFYAYENRESNIHAKGVANSIPDN